MAIRNRHEDYATLEDPRVPDLRDEAWYRCVQELADMRASGDYTWAAAMLANLQRQIESTRVVKAWQQRTLERIRESERSPSRNYDVTGIFRREPVPRRGQ